MKALPSFAKLALLSIGVALALPVLHALAQTCEDDAGALCTDDAGFDGADAGEVSDGAVDAAAEAVACSCTTDENTSGQGRIHLCTGSNESDICASLDCDRGTFRGSACAERGVRLCCDMPSRGLYSQLYDDCAHPNCEAGFLAQCRDFGGDVYEGACKNPGGSFDPAGHDDPADEGICSVTHVRAARDAERSPALLGGVSLALLLLVRRARRSARA